MTEVMPETRENKARPGDTDLAEPRATVWSLAGPLVSEESERHTPITTSPFEIGRHSRCDLSLASRAVSGHHAQLIVQGEQLLVVDLQSTNGTFVNGRRIEDRAELAPENLIQFADMPFRVCRHDPVGPSRTVKEDSVDHALALVQFETLMSGGALRPLYQPIVKLDDCSVVGYEVLGRSRLPRLETPDRMFLVAGQLKMEIPLSVMLRESGIQRLQNIGQKPHLFLNTHPLELRRGDLIESVRLMRQACGDQPLTIELHEAAVADLRTMKSFRDSLTEIDVRLAFDDFGAGQSRLIELLELHPDFVKFDIALIKGIDRAAAAQRLMMAALVSMVRDVGAMPLAEGIETESEADACRRLGFEMGQGFYFGRPVGI